MIRLRLPNITAPTATEKVDQIVAFLRQMVNDINALIDEIEMNQNGGNNNGR